MKKLQYQQLYLFNPPLAKELDKKSKKREKRWLQTPYRMPKMVWQS